MARFTDQELILAFSNQKPVKGLKQWQVCFYPRTNASIDHSADRLVIFSAANRADAHQMAIEYGLRINESIVRFIYLHKG
jgi:hypothetical protein